MIGIQNWYYGQMPDSTFFLHVTVLCCHRQIMRSCWKLLHQ